MVKTIYTREKKLSNLYTANIISRTIRSQATYIINTKMPFIVVPKQASNPFCIILQCHCLSLGPNLKQKIPRTRSALATLLSFSQLLNLNVSVIYILHIAQRC